MMIFSLRFAPLLVLGTWYLVFPQQEMETLLRDFKSDDAAVRSRAVQSALTRAPEWTPKDLDALRAAAAAGDRDVAPRAKETLERIEIRRKAGPTLVARYKGLDTLIRQGEREPCVALLGEVHGAIREGTLKVADLDALLELMLSWGVDLETDIFQLTSRPHQPYARVLRRMLKSEDEHTVASAIMRLARVGGKAEIPLILPFLKSPSSLLRQCAVSSFEEYRDRAAMEPILPFLKDPHIEVRKSALWTLGSLPARDCIDAVVPLLKDDDGGVRGVAIKTLGRMGALAQAGAIADLIRDPEVRETAMEALALLDAKSHAADLVPFLSDENEGLRADAGRTFARLDLKEAIRRSKPHLDGPKEGRWDAWLPFQNREARDHALSIVPFLKHAESDLRDWAVITLGQMGLADHAPAMAALLGDEQEGVRRSAAFGLACLALPKEKVDAAWIRRIGDLEAAAKKDKWLYTMALLRLGGLTRERQRALAQFMFENGTHETTSYYEDLMRGLGEMNEPATATLLGRRFSLEKPVATRADLEALFEARGLKLKGAPGQDIYGRTAAGRDVSLQDLATRHFDHNWHLVPEKDVVQLLWWDKAFDTWLRRLK